LLGNELSVGDWERFAVQIAVVAQVPTTDIVPSMRMADLDVDSLALSEIAVMLITEFGCDPLFGGHAGWETLTFSEIHQRASAGPRAWSRP
jgi:hypothetical protein